MPLSRQESERWTCNFIVESKSIYHPNREPHPKVLERKEKTPPSCGTEILKVKDSFPRFAFRFHHLSRSPDSFLPVGKGHPELLLRVFEADCTRMHRYTLGRTLGEGAFGRVRQAVHTESGEEVAVKTLKDKCRSLERAVSLPEFKALRSLSHENIVKCKDLILDEKGDVHMVFEMLHGGNLEKLTRNRTKPFSEHQIRSVFFQLLSAAKHMHSFNFLHRDIKPENILLLSPRFEYDARIKLADLGQAKRFSSSNGRPHTTYVATRWYRSPELLLRISSYSFPSDLWAIGAVMTELINLGEPLFPGSDEHDQLSRIVALRGHPSTVGWRNGEMAMKNRRIQLPRVTPSSLRKIVPSASLPVLQLISDLLELDPTRRPSAAEALQYPLFASYPLVLSQNPSRRKRKIESVEKDTARTRDFPSSRWSGDSEYELRGQNDADERNSIVDKWTRESTIENARMTSKKRKTSECRSILFKIPRIPSDNPDSSGDYSKLNTRRDPAGAFDLRTSG